MNFQKNIASSNNRSKALAVMHPPPSTFKGTTPEVALDCEMVECGYEKKVARITIVNYNGHVLYDGYIRPEERITNFLTFVSGITPALVKTAPFFKDEQKKIMSILSGRTIVGHSIHNDLAVLGITDHPTKLQRDISCFHGYQRDRKKLGLKTLASEFLGLNIQTEVEDARATMALYVLKKDQIDQALKFHH